MKQLLATVSLVIVASAASASNFDHDATQSTFQNWLNGYVEGIIKASDLLVDQVNKISDVAPDIDTPELEHEIEAPSSDQSTDAISNFADHYETSTVNLFEENITDDVDSVVAYILSLIHISEPTRPY